jgi:hypothetical protein
LSQYFQLWNSNQVSSTDIPWLQGANTGPNFNFLDIGGVAFNPLVPNQLIASAGSRGIYSLAGLAISFE